MKSDIKSLIDSTLPEIASHYAISLPASFDYDLEAPRSKDHGDLATNVALKLAKFVHRKPVEVGRQFQAMLSQKIGTTDALSRAIKRIEVEGPGFLNFFLEATAGNQILRSIHSLDERYGGSLVGNGKRVLLEYVSANPTGPLTIAHGRQACVGDALARILKATGHEVDSEYYLNDTGRQISILGRSTWLRYRECLGETIDFPEEGYQGDYIREIAAAVLKQEGDRFQHASEPQAIEFFAAFAAGEIMKEIREHLKELRVSFDRFSSEKELRASGEIEKLLETLRAKGFVYDKEGAVWFQSTQYGDDKDRVVRKSDGEYTYLAPDMAYHRDKFKRGYQWLINLWGPDHHGYVPRMKSAVKAMGGDENSLKVLLVQLTTLYRKGEPVRMSTRAGEFVTLKELMDEVGVDATRFFFLLRRVESLLDFDLDLAKEKSQENPVYYLQYAHARISSILEYAKIPVTDEVDLSLLGANEEFELVKQLQDYPEILIAAAQGLEPYRVVDYLRELATRFHKFYTLHRVVSENAELTRARLLLADCVRIVLRNGLEILGISHPAQM